jgi:hypothetical protein
MIYEHAVVIVGSVIAELVSALKNEGYKSYIEE